MAAEIPVTGLVQRVVLAAPVPGRGLLHAAADLVQRLARQPHRVEPVDHDRRGGQRPGEGGVVAAPGVQRDRPDAGQPAGMHRRFALIGLALLALGATACTAPADRAEPEAGNETAGPAGSGTAGPETLSGASPSADPGTGCSSLPSPLELSADANNAAVPVAFAELMSYLEEVAQQEGEVSAAVEALRSELEALSPEPASALESLGRLRLQGVDTADLLGQVSGELMRACNSLAFTEESLLSIDGLRPAPAADAAQGILVGGSLWGQPCESVVPIPPLRAGYRCGSEAVVVDLSDGSELARVDVGESAAVFSPAGVAWLRDVITPASGLQGQQEAVELSFASVEGGQVVTARVSDEGLSTRIMAVVRGRIAVAQVQDQFASESPIAIFDESGNRIADVGGARVNMIEGQEDWSHVTEHSLLVPSFGAEGSGLLNLFTGELQTFSPDFNYTAVVDTGCPSIGAYGAYATSPTLFGDEPPVDYNVIELAEELRVEPAFTTPISADSELRYIPSKRYVVSTDVSVVSNDFNDTLTGVGREGNQLWQFDGSVVSSFEVVGNYLTVTNPSEEVVVVDPVAGAEVAGLTSEQRAVIEGVGASLLWMTDILNGTAAYLYSGGAGSEAAIASIALDQLC